MPWKARERMYTNQAIDLDDVRVPGLRCHHAPGEATPENCAYLRAVERVRSWAERAEDSLNMGQNAGASDQRQRQLSELWLLFADVSAAHDLCPNTVAALPASR